jgi:hypothetical protein
MSISDKPSKFTRSECHNLRWTDNPSTLRRNVTVIKCHSRRFVGWTDSVGRNVTWSVCGWTDRQCTFMDPSWPGEYPSPPPTCPQPATVGSYSRPLLCAELYDVASLLGGEAGQLRSALLARSTLLANDLVLSEVRLSHVHSFFTLPSTWSLDTSIQRRLGHINVKVCWAQFHSGGFHTNRILSIVSDTDI